MPAHGLGFSEDRVQPNDNDPPQADTPYGLESLFHEKQDS